MAARKKTTRKAAGTPMRKTPTARKRTAPAKAAPESKARRAQAGGRLRELIDNGDTAELARRAMTLQTVLLDLHRQLGRAASQGELARGMALALTGSFGCARLAILRRDRTRRRFECVAQIGDVPPALHEASPAAGAQIAPFLPHLAPLAPLLPPPADAARPGAETLAGLGFERAAWLNVEKQVDWLVLAGPKLSGAEYDEFDVSLLRATFDAANLACSRLLLVDALEERNRALAGANERLLQIDDLKSTILNGVGDELRTPLSRILSYSEALRDDEVDAGDRMRFLDVVVENTRHLGTRINQALRYASLVDGRTPPKAERVLLHELVRDLTGARHADAEARSLRLETSTVGLAASTDPTLLRFALDCILDNALRFTPAGGAVTVQLEEHDAGAIVRIIDTGKGVPDEARRRIWRLFETGEMSLTRADRSLGIGLALARRLALDLGFHLELERSDSTGSVFALHIPDAAPAAQTAAEHAGALR